MISQGRNLLLHVNERIHSKTQRQISLAEVSDMPALSFAEELTFRSTAAAANTPPVNLSSTAQLTAGRTPCSAANISGNVLVPFWSSFSGLHRSGAP
ncbi:hypothetical protein R1flu_002126 [Riccia fluitans]|uniref:Uncharacterized protein n=1 Tax=Riccia fluitans TaxID=41844 RepID=A0ABD1Y578_9MARC